MACLLAWGLPLSRLRFCLRGWSPPRCHKTDYTGYVLLWLFVCLHVWLAPPRARAAAEYERGVHGSKSKPSCELSNMSELITNSVLKKERRLIDKDTASDELNLELESLNGSPMSVRPSVSLHHFPSAPLTISEVGRLPNSAANYTCI